MVSTLSRSMLLVTRCAGWSARSTTRFLVSGDGRCRATGTGSWATAGQTRLRSRVGTRQLPTRGAEDGPEGGEARLVLQPLAVLLQGRGHDDVAALSTGRYQSAEVDTSTPGSTSCRPRRWPASSKGGSVVRSGPRCRTLSPDRAVRVWIRSPAGVVVSLTRTSGNASSRAASAAHRGGAELRVGQRDRVSAAGAQAEGADPTGQPTDRHLGRRGQGAHEARGRHHHEDEDEDPVGDAAASGGPLHVTTASQPAVPLMSAGRSRPCG